MRRRKTRAIAIIYWLIVIALIIAIAIVAISLVNDQNNYKDDRGTSQISSDSVPESIPNMSSMEVLSSEPDPYEGLEKITIDNSSSVDGDLMLVNKDYGVPEKYEEADYPSIYGEGTPYVVRSTEMYLQPQALEALREMLSVAKEDGIKGMMIVDGYRLNSKQVRLFDNSVSRFVESGMTKEEATAKTAETVAYPGHSEHQIGLAIDVDLHDIEYDDFADTEFAIWLAENCYKYGYILRYPADKQDITNISYESWHFRYVGKAHAEYMEKNGICLEEYIELLKETEVIELDSENGTHYTITYIQMSEGDTTECYIPENSEYEVSSDNAGGFVVVSWEEQ